MELKQSIFIPKSKVKYLNGFLAHLNKNGLLANEKETLLYITKMFSAKYKKKSNYYGSIVKNNNMFIFTNFKNIVLGIPKKGGK